MKKTKYKSWVRLSIKTWLELSFLGFYRQYAWLWYVLQREQSFFRSNYFLPTWTIRADRQVPGWSLLVLHAMQTVCGLYHNPPTIKWKQINNNTNIRGCLFPYVKKMAKINKKCFRCWENFNFFLSWNDIQY